MGKKKLLVLCFSDTFLQISEVTLSYHFGKLAIVMIQDMVLIDGLTGYSNQYIETQCSCCPNNIQCLQELAACKLQHTINCNRSPVESSCFRKILHKLQLSWLKRFFKNNSYIFCYAMFHFWRIKKIKFSMHVYRWIRLRYKQMYSTEKYVSTSEKLGNERQLTLRLHYI